MSTYTERNALSRSVRNITGETKFSAICHVITMTVGKVPVKYHWDFLASNNITGRTATIFMEELYLKKGVLYEDLV